MTIMTIITNEIDYCCNCGQPTDGEFCSSGCEEDLQTSYQEDMAEMPPEPLCDVVERNLCPVCQDRPKSPGMGTCLNANCQDCWQMAWETK